METPSHRLSDLTLARVADAICKRMGDESLEANRAVTFALWGLRPGLEVLLQRRRERQREPVTFEEAVDVAEGLYRITHPALAGRMHATLSVILGGIDEDKFELARDICQTVRKRAISYLGNPASDRVLNWDAYLITAVRNEGLRRRAQFSKRAARTERVTHELLAQRQRATGSLRLADVMDRAQINEMFDLWLPLFLERKVENQRRDRRVRDVATPRADGFALVIRLWRRYNYRKTPNAMRLRAEAIVARGNRHRRRFDVEVPDKNTLYRWLREFGDFVEASARNSSDDTGGVAGVLKNFFKEV